MACQPSSLIEESEIERRRWNMRLPDEVRIGANDYSVKLVESLLSHSERLGDVTYFNATIRIDNSLSKSILRETLAHELIHAMLYEAGYEEHDEGQVVLLGKVLAMLLRDNDFTFMRDDTESSTEEGFKSIMGHPGASSNDPTGDPMGDPVNQVSKKRLT